MAELLENWEINREPRWPILSRLAAASLVLHAALVASAIYVPGVRSALNLAYLFSDTKYVDEEGSRELLTSLRLLRPRHLPLVVTIGDRDLKGVVREIPASLPDLFTQSVAEEIIYQREAALRLVESQGGLALDVTAAALAPALLEKYLQVKERGLL